MTTQKAEEKSLEAIQRLVLKAASQFALGGLLLAALIWVLLTGGIESLLFVTVFPASFIAALLGLAGAVFLLSQLGGKLLFQGKTNPIVVGLSMPLLSLAFAVLLGSLPMYFAEGLNHESGLFDYIGKPLYWVMTFGAIPCLVLGLFLGLVVRDRLNPKPSATKATND